jgi:4-amino-4-deoxy-L-arabinose transferase-like glycosyltransferase
MVILCLWLALWLRLWGLDFGLPYDFQPDEHQYVDVALNWHLTGQMQLRFVNPPLFTYLLAAAYGPWIALTPFSPTPAWITTAYIFARFWSVFFGVLIVALIYPIGKQLYRQNAGVLAVVLMTGLFLPGREAHFAVNDTIVTFFVLLTIYFSLRIIRYRTWPNYVLAGAAVGLSAGAKLTGGLVVVSLLGAHIATSWPPNGSIKALIVGRREHRLLGFGLLAALITFSGVMIHILWNIPEFMAGLTKVIQFGAEGHKGVRMAPGSGWQFYIDVFGWGMGWFMLLAGLVGLLIAIIRRQPAGLVLAIFPLALFIGLGSQQAFSARYILPALPPLVALAAAGLTWLETHWPWGHRYQTWLWPVLVSMLLAQPLAYLVWFDHLLTLPDTRQLATDWFLQEFPEDTVVAVENYSIFPRQAVLNNHWSYKIIGLDELGPTRNDANYYLARKTDVIAISNYTADRVRQNPAEETARLAQLAWLAEKAELIKEFNPYRAGYDESWFYLDQLYGPAGETWQRERPGPLLRLYHLPYENQPFDRALPQISVPVEANFGDKLMLLGYDLANRRAQPGQAFTITLYWQALTRMDKTYVVFNHLLDEGQRNWGGYDRWPQETAKTTLWQPGEVVVDTFDVPSASDTPDGIYTLDIGLYDQADSAARPLRIVRDGSPIDQNSIRIGPLKVGQAPPDLVFSRQQIAPQTELLIKFGEPPVIQIRGYDLTRRDDALHLKLYWESLTQSTIDWSVFVHVRNQSGETIAQKDGPAGNGRYPASLWDPGEIISDEIVIPLPANLTADDYRLVIGLYDYQTGQRLAIPGHQANELTLDANRG